MIMGLIDIDPLARTILLVVIEKDNLDRMRQADPITLESNKLGGFLQPIKYPQNFSLLIAYEEADEKLYAMAKTDDMTGLLQYLERGRKWVEGQEWNSSNLPQSRQSLKPTLFAPAVCLIPAKRPCLLPALGVIWREEETNTCHYGTGRMAHLQARRPSQPSRH